jgi:hypothetical protein
VQFAGWLQCEVYRPCSGRVQQSVPLDLKLLVVGYQVAREKVKREAGDRGRVAGVRPGYRVVDTCRCRCRCRVQ